MEEGYTDGGGGEGERGRGDDEWGRGKGLRIIHLLTLNKLAVFCGRLLPNLNDPSRHFRETFERGNFRWQKGPPPDTMPDVERVYDGTMFRG